MNLLTDGLPALALSADPLAIIVVGALALPVPASLHSITMEFSATIAGTNSKVLLRGTLINLGDVPIKMKSTIVTNVLQPPDHLVIKITVLRSELEEDWKLARENLELKKIDPFKIS